MFLIRTHRERSILSGFPKVYRSVIALRRLGSEGSIIGSHFGVPKTVKVCSKKRSGPRGVCVEVPFDWGRIAFSPIWMVLARRR